MEIYFGMGCFWGAERRFWQQPGVTLTQVGYAGGVSDQPSYAQVCSGGTGHAEVVKVVFDESQTRLADLLKVFWESHDPTQGNRQGNDIGTQYRSVIYATRQEDYEEILRSKDLYDQALARAGKGAVTTEVRYPAPTFWAAEEYHQRYLEKNPDGYCGLRGTGVTAQT